MAVFLDAFDDVVGRKAALTSRTPRRWRTLNTIACEQIARRRAQRLLDENKIMDAVPWLKHANAMMIRNNIQRLVRMHGAS